MIKTTSVLLIFYFYSISINIRRLTHRTRLCTSEPSCFYSSRRNYFFLSSRVECSRCLEFVHRVNSHVLTVLCLDSISRIVVRISGPSPSRSINFPINGILSVVTNLPRHVFLCKGGTTPEQVRGQGSFSKDHRVLPGRYLKYRWIKLADEYSSKVSKDNVHALVSTHFLRLFRFFFVVSFVFFVTRC